MLVLAGHQKSMSPTCLFLNRENRPRKGKEFLQGLIAGPVHILVHKFVHTCGYFSQVHQSTWGPPGPGDSAGWSKTGSDGKKDSGTCGAGEVRTWAPLWHGVSLVPGAGAASQGVLLLDSAPSVYEAWTAPDQLGPGKVRLVWRGGSFWMRLHCPRPGPSSAGAANVGVAYPALGQIEVQGESCSSLRGSRCTRRKVGSPPPEP